MKIKHFKNLIALCALLLSGPLAAHTYLYTSVPSANAVLAQSPPALELTYTGDSRLLRLSLVEKTRGEIDLAFRPTATPAASFRLDLPQLQIGDYTLRWVSMGEDGHRMSGEIPFRITGEESAQ